MRKVFAFVLCICVLLSLCACKQNQDNSAEKTETPKADSSEPAALENAYTKYGTEDQFLYVHKDTDTGSFAQPHQRGERIRLRHSDIHAGKAGAEAVNIYDYNLTLTDVLTGEAAKQKMKENCSNYDEEAYMFEDYDIYLLQLHFKYNNESMVKDHLPVDIYVAAVDAQDTFVNAEYRFDDRSYSNATPQGEVSNWYPVFVKKDATARPVFVIGSPMEYPGAVVKVYLNSALQ